MSQIKINEIGMKVGLEIHQQLSTRKKLFCNCRPTESDEYTTKFSRRLRVSKSELGQYDPAALFEYSKSKSIVYYANPQSSCLVERDEEPPHDIDCDAKNIAMVIASALKSNIFTEIYPMRKTVIDGSNTSGFQRTMLVSQGGYLKVDGNQVGVQSICLEEDAAKKLQEGETEKEYSLDRLGIPLVEIALEPVSTSSPAEVKKIALTLGRMLRTTKKVTRGIGSIRQDVNISINNDDQKRTEGIVEVKGVQQLDQLEKIIEYEAKRQHGLIQISEKLKEIGQGKISIKDDDVFNITEIFKSCNSKIIQNSLKKKDTVIKAIRVRNFAGILGLEPYSDVRLGKEIGELVRFFGIGGVFHLDELPNYGIENSDVDQVKKLLDIGTNDSFIIIAGQISKIGFAIESIINRIEQAKKGIPSETRMATASGQTVYLRPRPGASRMYPETDIPPIIVTPEQIEFAKKIIPKSWEESLSDLQRKYKLNKQLSEQIFDSDYLDIFEKICADKNHSPNFVASILCSTITNLERQGLDKTLLTPEEIIHSFVWLAQGKIAKESMEIIFQSIMSGNSTTIQEAINKEGTAVMDENELEKILDDIIQNSSDVITSQGPRSAGVLMGVAMKTLRGKASGEKVNQLLQKKIQQYIENKNKK